jgi:hypothetical protein
MSGAEDLRAFDGVRYAIQATYAVPDDAWYLELSEAGPAGLPGSAFLTAIVPDEDPSREPMIAFPPTAEREVPYRVMRWFMEKVTEEVERSRAAFDRRLQAGQQPGG